MDKNNCPSGLVCKYLRTTKRTDGALITINTEYEIPWKGELKDSPHSGEIIQSHLNRAGEDGWELVTFLPAPVTHVQETVPGIYGVAGAEFFPALIIDTGELFAGCEKLDLVCIFNGRGGQIRTDDPLLPKQMRYQAALRPDFINLTPLAAAAYSTCRTNQPSQWGR